MVYFGSYRKITYNQPVATLTKISWALITKIGTNIRR